MKSNRITLLVCSLISALAFACSGHDPIEDTSDGEGDGADVATELGTAEQDLSANGPNYGIAIPNSHLACNTTNSGQSCLVPKDLVQTYCYTGFTTAQQSSFDVAIGSFNTQNGFHFQWNRALISAADCLAGVAGSGAVLIRPGTGNCSGGATSGSVDAYVCYVPAHLTALTESVPGTWQRMAGGDIFVDSADLITQDITVNGCVGLHGIRHAIAAASGLGANNPSCSGTFDPLGACITNRNIAPKSFNGFCGHDVLSNQEKCEAASYNRSSPLTWAFNASSCPL